MYVCCLLQKRARSLELAPEQTRNQQLVFNNPEQLRGGDPSFFNNYFNSDNTFFKEQQFPSSSSLTGSSSNLDVQSLSGQNLRATTYKPTVNLHRQQNHPQIGNQNHNHQQFHHQQRQPQASQTQLVAQPPPRDVPVEIVPSITLADTSFIGQPPPPPQQGFDNGFQQAQERSFTFAQQRDFIPAQQQPFNVVNSQERPLNIIPSQERSLNIFPSQERSLNFAPAQERTVSIVQSQERSLDNFPVRSFNTAQTQQSNTFIRPNPTHFNNHAPILQQTRPNNVAESRVHPNRIAVNNNNNINGGSFSRIAFNGVGGPESFVRYK